MKTLTPLLAALLLAASLPLHGQQYQIQLHSGGQIVHSATAGSNPTMTFSNGNASLTSDGTSWSAPIDHIDSLTFASIETSGDTLRIAWNGSSASFSNPFTAQGVSVSSSGAHVTVTSSSTDIIPFFLTGSSPDGSLTLTTAKKITLRIENLDLTSSSGPAIDINGGKKSTFTLCGDNNLSDATNGTHKAALQSKGDLVFRGTGSLTVTGNTRHGIRTKENFYLENGSLLVTSNGTVSLITTGSGYEPDYANGIKVGGITEISGGSLTVICPTTNAGAKAISCDSSLTILGGTLNLSATGPCARYTDSTGNYDSYASTGIKADGDILIAGGSITISAGGRAINTDASFTQTGGSIYASTSAAGFGTVPYSSYGNYFSDGFSPACLKADGNITFLGGTFNGSSSGTAGRGIHGKGSLTIGSADNTNSSANTPHVYVTTSGAPFLVSSSSTYWRGLPKGVKIQGDITVNSGILQSYCSQTTSGSGSSNPGAKQPNGEAIESKASIYINGGTVEANALDDAINATSYIQINGGRVWAYARNNDAIDCNGSRIDINGGTVIAQGSDAAIDDNGDRGGRLYISGGTIVLIGGSMGTTEATPSLSGQKSITLGSSSGNPWGGGSSSSVSPTNGFCIKNSSGTAVLTFKAPSVSGSGFATAAPTATGIGGGAKPPSGGNSIYISSPDIQSGSYTYFTSPSISGGSQWHGLYSGATVTTSGNGSSVTAQ